MLDKIDRQIIEYLNNGLKQKEIAKKFSVTKQAISSRVKKLRELGEIIDKSAEIDQSILKGLKEGKTKAKISKELQLSVHTISYRAMKMRNQGVEIPDRSVEIDRRILAGLAERKTHKQIAEELNMSQSGIEVRIAKMKKKGIVIPVRSPGRKKDISLKTISESTTTMEKQDEGRNDSEIIAGLINLTKTKHATRDQIQVIAEYYGIDFNMVLSSLDEQER